MFPSLFCRSYRRSGYFTISKNDVAYNITVITNLTSEEQCHRYNIICPKSQEHFHLDFNYLDAKFGWCTERKMTNGGKSYLLKSYCVRGLKKNIYQTSRFKKYK